MLAQGHEEIATILNVTPFKTVEFHKAGMMRSRTSHSTAELDTKHALK